MCRIFRRYSIEDQLSYELDDVCHEFAEYTFDSSEDCVIGEDWFTPERLTKIHHPNTPSSS